MAEWIILETSFLQQTLQMLVLQTIFSTLTESKLKNKVHANPSITLDEVKLSVDNFSGELIIHIYDINGKWVSTQVGDTVSMSKYKKGLYILEVHYNHLNESITIVKL